MIFRITLQLNDMVLFLVAVASIMEKRTVFIFRVEVKAWWENDM